MSFRKNNLQFDDSVGPLAAPWLGRPRHERNIRPSVVGFLGSMAANGFEAARSGLFAILFYSRPGFSITAVVIVSAKADTVVHVLADRAKAAADQCTGTRPAVITMQLIDQISRPEMEILLKNPNGLHQIARAVFDSPKRLHVDSIVFTIPQVPNIDSEGTKRLSAPVVVLHNPNLQFPCDHARSLFRRHESRS